MKYFYIIANLDKEYIQGAQVFTKAYLEAKGAECLLHHTSKGTKGGAHTDRTQVPGNAECVITVGGDGTLIQAARDLAGRNIPILEVNRGHLGYLDQMSHQGDIAPALESLLDERHQLERRMMMHGTAWRKEEIFLKDIALNEIAITKKDPLKMLHYSVYVNDEHLNEYATGDVLIATPTGSTTYNPSAGGPAIASGARMMVLVPICSRSFNARSIVLAPEDRVRIKVLNSGQIASSGGDTFTELKAGDCIDIRCSELQTVMIKLKQILFIRNLNNHPGRL